MKDKHSLGLVLLFFLAAIVWVGCTNRKAEKQNFLIEQSIVKDVDNSVEH